MKALHYFLAAIVIIAQIGVTALLVLSVAPIAMGGIMVDLERDPTATTSDGMFIFDGEAIVESNMFWDIVVRYDVILGNEDITVASLSDNGEITIERGSRTSLPFHLEVPMVNAAMFIMSTGINDNGDLKNEMTIPLTFVVHVEYIRGLMKFDLNLMIEESVGINLENSDIQLNDNGRQLIIDIDFDDTSMIPQANENYSILIETGSTDITGNLGISTMTSNELHLELGSGEGNILDLVKEAYDDGSLSITVTDGSENYVLGEDEIEIFISILESIFASAVGP